MLQIEITQPDGSTKVVHAPDESMIGKGAQNEIRLDSWRIAREHARLIKTPAGVLVEDMGAFSGVHVNDKRVNVQYGPLKDSDIIVIGPYRMRVVPAARAEAASQAAHPASRSATDDARNQQAADKPRAARRGAEDYGRNRDERTEAPASAPVVGPDPQLIDLEFEWRKILHGRLLETMDLRRHDIHQMTDDRLREETRKLIGQIIEESAQEIPAELDREALARQVLNEAIGLGPLEDLIEDQTVTEIMVNRYDEIYIERAGKLLRHPLTFTGPRAVMGVIERIVAPLGRRIDESSPMVDARLKDGSRVNAIIPPLAIKGPCLTIRKFAKRKLTASDLVDFGSLSPAMAEFLEVCVQARKNVIVSGGTGSGKTTLLNILGNFIPCNERIITIEDAAELKLHHEHLISLEARPANVEGRGAVGIRDLVRNTLRMRPDRIVVGECRGAEALDMLQAMNTGHEGSLTTLHANSVRDALARLETMVLMAGMDLPLLAIREQIASAVDIVIQQNRFSCGSRIVTHIAEITGMESGTIQLQELFCYHSEGHATPDRKISGFFSGCNTIPSFYEELLATGHALDIGIFRPESAAEDILETLVDEPA